MQQPHWTPSLLPLLGRHASHQWPLIDTPCFLAPEPHTHCPLTSCRPAPGQESVLTPMFFPLPAGWGPSNGAHACGSLSHLPVHVSPSVPLLWPSPFKLQISKATWRSPTSTCPPLSLVSLLCSLMTDHLSPSRQFLLPTGTRLET